MPPTLCEGAPPPGMPQGGYSPIESVILRDPVQAYVKQRESKKIKERKRGPGVKLEIKGKKKKKTIGVLSRTEMYRWA